MLWPRRASCRADICIWPSPQMVHDVNTYFTKVMSRESSREKAVETAVAAESADRDAVIASALQALADANNLHVPPEVAAAFKGTDGSRGPSSRRPRRSAAGSTRGSSSSVATAVTPRALQFGEVATPKGRHWRFDDEGTPQLVSEDPEEVPLPAGLDSD